MFEEIKALLVEEMSIDESEIKESAEFINDLGFNSLELADLVALCDASYFLEMLVDDFDGYGNWEYYFYIGYYFAFADEAEVVDYMTYIIIDAYQGI